MVFTLPPESVAAPDMVSVAAHELRTPLTVVTALAQMLERDLQRRIARGAPAAQDWESEQRRLLSRTLELRRAAMKLQAVAEDMLAIRQSEGRWRPVDPVPTDLRLLVEAVVDECLMVTDQHVLSVHVDDSPCLVWADPLRLEQVLRNLINNAIAYSPMGGSVDLRVHTSADSVLLDVRDEGVGIQPEQLEAIFLPFFRGSHPADLGSHGSGLGLYLSAKIIEGHDGAIWADSDPPRGSTFHVRLPRYELRQFGGVLTLAEQAVTAEGG